MITQKTLDARYAAFNSATVEPAYECYVTPYDRLVAGESLFGSTSYRLLKKDISFLAACLAPDSSKAAQDLVVTQLLALGVVVIARGSYWLMSTADLKKMVK